MKKALFILLLSSCVISFSQCPWNFTVNSQPGFTITCSVTSITLSAVNNNSNAISYNWITPAGNFSTNSTQLLSGGNCTVTLTDVTNSCVVTQTFNVFTNTLNPDLGLTLNPPTYTLTCNNPTVLATGSSTTNASSVSWLVPSTPSLILSPTIVVGPPTGPPTTSNSLTYANYTIVATNTLNGCSSSSVVNIYQNFTSAPYFVTVSIGSPTNLCDGPVVIVATCTNCWGDPWGWPGNPHWYGPAPQATAMGQSSYSCYVPGVYTLNTQDNYTGCWRTSTLNITDSRPQFYLTGSPPTNSLSCDGNVFINPIQPYGATVSVSSGSLNGTTINNLCNGWVKVCLTFPSSGCVKCDSIMMDASVGLTEAEKYAAPTIFLDPSARILTFSGVTNGTRIRLLSLDGKIIRQEDLHQMQLDISELQAGIYLLELKSERFKVTKKLVVC